jgi:hypothetical protein
VTEEVLCKDTRAYLVGNPLPVLPSEWREHARHAANSFGYGALHDIPDDQWQRVLTHVQGEMRRRGVGLPKGWRTSLAKQVGRNGV